MSKGDPKKPEKLREPGNPFDWCDDLPVTEAEMLKAYRAGDLHAVAAYGQWVELQRGTEKMLARERQREQGKQHAESLTKDALDRGQEFLDEARQVARESGYSLGLNAVAKQVSSLHLEDGKVPRGCSWQSVKRHLVAAGFDPHQPP